MVPWRRTIATRVRNGNQNCWRLTDVEGRVRDEPQPQHGTPLGLTGDEGITENSLTGDEWLEYYGAHDTVLRQAAEAETEAPGIKSSPVKRRSGDDLAQLAVGECP